MLDWFEPHELEPCPCCSERFGLPIRRARTFVCFGCGYVRWSGGETTVSELQGRDPRRPVRAALARRQDDDD